MEMAKGADNLDNKYAQWLLNYALFLWKELLSEYYFSKIDFCSPSLPGFGICVLSSSYVDVCSLSLQGFNIGKEQTFSRIEHLVLILLGIGIHVLLFSIF